MAERRAWTVPFRAVAVVHGLAVIAQPVLAGAVLDAVDGAIDAHAAVAGVVLLLGMVQVVVAVLAWRPGRLPWWPAVLAAAILLAETAQVALGVAGILAAHVPLGVTIVGTQVVLAVAAVRMSAQPERGVTSPVS